MNSSFKSLKDVFNNDPELRAIRDSVKENDIVNDFFKIFPRLTKIVTSVKVNKHKLIIKVENPAWRQELKHKEESIIKKINSFYNEERITQTSVTY